MKVALVCDWLTNVGGAEKVLLELHHLYPKAPIYTSQYNPRKIDWFRGADVRTGWLRIFPSYLRRFLGPLRFRYFSRLDLSDYDLIISVTGAEAKAVKSGKWLHEHGVSGVKCPNGLHISYCHVPTQYYWQMYDEYVREPGFGFLNPLVRVCFKTLVKPLRKRDYEAAQRVDAFVTISDYAKGLISKYYKRDAVVIHPPVDTENFKVGGADARFRAASGRPVATGGRRSSSCCRALEALQTSNRCHPPYYVTTSRQVNWKRIDLAVKACARTKRELLVVGEGPEHNKLVKMTEKCENVKFLPLQGRETLAELLAGTKGMIFPSMEPFGIAPVEALAAGCPVVAFGEGGALDYVKDGENGVLFEKQTVNSLVSALDKFEKMDFDRKKVSKSVEKFGVERFDDEIRKFVDEKMIHANERMVREKNEKTRNS